MIRASALTVTLARTRVVHRAGLTAETGKTLGLIGPNGSGKTTLLRCLHGALHPSAGLVTLEGRAVQELSSSALARRVATVSQEPPSDAGFTIRELVLLGRLPHRRSHQRFTPSDEHLADEALRLVGLDALSERPLNQLSGGERQRALIARCLAQGVDHLLLDEPTNHLDIRYQHEVLDLVASLGHTTVVVLHDLNLAARYCDELVLLAGGEVVRHGPVRQVLEPAVIEAVYGVTVRRYEDAGAVQLAFGPPRPRPARPMAGTAADRAADTVAGAATEPRRDRRLARWLTRWLVR